MARGAGNYATWTEPQLETLFAMRAQGASFAKIAAALDMPRQRVKDRYRYIPGRRSKRPAAAQERNRSHHDTRDAERVTLACLCCSRPFASVNRRTNRMCTGCSGIEATA